MVLAIYAARHADQEYTDPVTTVLGAEQCTIGRGNECDVVLEDQTRRVSRRHVTILRRSGSYLLHVISQINPVVVNGEVLAPGAQQVLRAGDRMIIGEYEFGFVQVEEAEPLSIIPAHPLRADRRDDLDVLFGDRTPPPAPAAKPPPSDLHDLLGGRSSKAADPLLDVLGGGGAPRRPGAADPLQDLLGQGRDSVHASTGSPDEHMHGGGGESPIDALLNKPGMPGADPLGLTREGALPGRQGQFGGGRGGSVEIDHVHPVHLPLPSTYSRPEPGATPTPSPWSVPSAQPAAFADPLFPSAPGPAAGAPQALPPALEPFPAALDLPAAAEPFPSALKPWPAVPDPFPAALDPSAVDPLAGASGPFSVASNPLQPAPSPLPSTSDALQPAPDPLPGPDPLSALLGEAGRRAPGADPLGLFGTETPPATAQQAPAPWAAAAGSGAETVRSPYRSAAELRAAPAPPPVQPMPSSPRRDVVSAPAQALAKAPSAAGALAAFMQGAGMERVDLSQADADALIAECGATVRAAVEGLMGMLLARAKVKEELRAADRTMVAARENNALKLAESVDEALQFVFDPAARSDAFLPPSKAVADACADLQNHELALVAGMRAALLGAIKRFDPEVVEKRLQKEGSKSLLANRKAQLWDCFVAFYQQTQTEADDNFDRVFGAAFLRAYQEQIRRLSR